MPYIIEGENVYYVDDVTKMCIGSATKTESPRLDENTVEDVEYKFIINGDGSGDYVEQKRTSRIDPVQPEPETADQKISRLEAENADLKTRISDVEMFVADMISTTP
jgi:hypothetical protein